MTGRANLEKKLHKNPSSNFSFNNSGTREIKNLKKLSNKEIHVTPISALVLGLKSYGLVYEVF